MDFVSLGSEQVGTQALAKEVTGFFSLALGSIQQQMMEAWNKQLVDYLFQWNHASFSDRTGNPQIRWSKPGKLNIQSLANTVSSLLSSESIHYNNELEHWIREMFEMPEISDAEIDEAVKKKEEAAMPGFGPEGPGEPGEQKQKEGGKLGNGPTKKDNRQPADMAS